MAVKLTIDQNLAVKFMGKALKNNKTHITPNRKDKAIKQVVLSRNKASSNHFKTIIVFTNSSPFTVLNF